MEVLMELTVLITNYNYGCYLREAIASIADLHGIDSKNISVLVGDDASSDNSVAVIQDLRNEYCSCFADFRVYLQCTNLGKNALLNLMIPDIDTPYAVILDADDWLKPDFITATSLIFEEYAEDPKFGFVYTDCELVDQDGMPIGFGKSTYFSAGLIKKCSYIPQTNLIRTEALKSCIPLDERVLVGTKHHQWNRICGKGWYGVYLAKRTFCYRMHSRNLSSIGHRILAEEDNGVKHRLLQGYWPTAGGRSLSAWEENETGPK
jgi:glycosyltransferase involved in cell wall biosynthesis